MRTLLKKLSSSIFLILISLKIYARPVAQVVDISGNVFTVGIQGSTTHLKLNHHIEENSEILVAEDGLMVLNDYYDTSYHLTGGTHIKFFNKSVQLKKGKIWVKSVNSRYPLALTTANGQIDFIKSEFIVTFDQSNNRSQVLVINGDVDVSNILNKDIKFLIPGGSFTLIDPEVDNGIPRNPTTVGPQSLQAAMEVFKKFPDKAVERKVIERKIASVTGGPDTKVSTDVSSAKGKIIYLKTNREIASVERGEAHEYYNKITKKEKKIKSSNKIKIGIFGSSWMKPTHLVKFESKKQRGPASIKVVSPEGPKFNRSPKQTSTSPMDPEFESSLQRHQKDQPKYPQELNNLIEELKSY